MTATMFDVFICSPLKANGDNTMEFNIARAVEFCRFACDAGLDPFAPHIHYTQFMDDNNPLHRSQAMVWGLKHLRKCKELWAFCVGYKNASDGMKEEIREALSCGVPVRFFCPVTLREITEELTYA